MTPTVSSRKALSDPNLLGTTLAGLDTWSAWRTAPHRDDGRKS